MKTTAFFYSHILQNHEATEQNAIDHAKHFNFSEDEATQNTISFLTYINTFNSVDIWYCIGTDSYYFSDNTK